ncbi:MAG: hypothetical protein J4F34_09445 [Gemmatimonadetes bacterium]|nr:hypothetical protein [Gemmatimonadota bacterium]
MYHPIMAVGEAGNILDLRLREGQVHTADGGLEFVLERAERHLCGNSAVDFDAGYPGEPRAWGLRVVPPGRVVVPLPQGRAGLRRAKGPLAVCC